MKILSALFILMLIGCSNSKPVFGSHESRSRLVKKENDSSFTFDIRSKVKYGEFFNLMAKTAVNIKSDISFITLNFKTRTGEHYMFRTYLPKRRKPEEPVDSSHFYITFGKKLHDSSERPQYFLEFSKKSIEEISLEKAVKKIDSLKQDRLFENFLVIMASDQMDMETEVIPMLKIIQRFAIPKNSFSAYVQN